MSKEHKNAYKIDVTNPPTLYKRTATGAVQIWRMEIQGGKYRTISGQQNGKLTTSEWTQAERMNAGKKNERSPAEQARFEVLSQYTKKLDVDYHLNPGSIDQAKIYKPMLAEFYKDYKDDLDFSAGVYVQPKLDGMRCIAKRDGLWSRKGKPVLSAPHIISALAPLFAEAPDLVLDGELYNHEYKDDFNSIMSACKKTTSLTRENLKISAQVVQFHIYDIPSVEQKYKTRHQSIIALFKANFWRHNSIKMVETVRAESHVHIDELYRSFLEDGYEGGIIRQNEMYFQKRTKALLKRKETLTDEFLVLEIMQGVGNWSGKAKSVRVKTKYGECEVGVKGSMEHCADVFKNRKKYERKKATVEYRGWTPDKAIKQGVVKEFARADI